MRGGEPFLPRTPSRTTPSSDTVCSRIACRLTLDPVSVAAPDMIDPPNEPLPLPVEKNALKTHTVIDGNGGLEGTTNTDTRK
jgi:hypothetical protein